MKPEAVLGRRCQKVVAYIRFLGKMKPHIRRAHLRMDLQMVIYWVWCKVRREKFSYSPYDLPFEPGKYVVVKGIPGIGITVFGKTLWISVDMALKYKRVQNGGEDGAEHKGSLPIDKPDPQ